jgi:type III pantothenate kinase
VTPDVVVDVGNSRVKWGRVKDGQVVEMVAFPHDDAVGWKRQAEEWGLSEGTKWAVAGVHPHQIGRMVDWISSRNEFVEVIDTNRFLSHSDRTGFWVELDESERIGVDRLMTAFAAWKRLPAFVPAGIVTVGTAITVDLVKPGGYFAGGAILPGPTLMARSLHSCTAKLPLIDATPDLSNYGPGKDTTSAILLGITAAVVGSADQLIWRWSRLFAEPPWVFISGGGASYFARFEFTANPAKVICDRTLTLDGLRLAAEALP